MACSRAPDGSHLTSQIQSKFNDDSGLHGKAITVQISGGVVTLSGTVDNETQRVAAARYASTVPEIKEVVNNLEITPAAPVAANDATQGPLPPENPTATTSPAKTSSAKPGPSRPRRQTEPEADSTDTASNTPPPPAEDKGTANANPDSDQQVPPAPAPQPPLPPPPVPRNVTVPSGTNITVRLLDSIDSENAQSGQSFRATLDSPLPTDGDAIIPAGDDVKGHIVDVKSAGKFAGQALLVLQIDSISIGGKSYNIDSDPYRRQGSNRATKTAEKVGAGAVLGAIIGGIAGGGKGAGIGATAGGGIGGGVQAASKGQSIQLSSETVLNFTLNSPLTVMLTDKVQEPGRPKLDVPQ
ncbi:MAG: BON domain-containing protein [Terriglobales bacterium]